MGRPRKELDWHTLDSLATLDASLNYCAERQLIKWGEEVSQQTIKAAREVIERRIQEKFDLTFTEYKDQKKEPVRIKLKQKQIEIAMGGNVTMLIWLGKQYLGQSEKHEVSQDAKGTLTVNFSKPRKA
jgi:hypothetical protein